MSRSTFRYGPNMNGGKPKKKSKGTPLLSTENVIDMDLGVLRDKEGKEYQANMDRYGNFMGLRRISKRRYEK